MKLPDTDVAVRWMAFSGRLFFLDAGNREVAAAGLCGATRAVTRVAMHVRGFRCLPPGFSQDRKGLRTSRFAHRWPLDRSSDHKREH